MKKTLSVLLALVLLLMMCVPAMAEESTYSITVKNTNENVTIAGNTYYAYKLFDAVYTGENVGYTVSDEFAGFEYKVGDTPYSGPALVAYLGTLDSDSDALNAFAKAALVYAETNSITPAGSVKVPTGQTAGDEEAMIPLTAPGYYLVTGTATAPDNQTLTAACMLDTAKPNMTVNVKVDAPTIDKKIVEGSSRVDANTSGIGKVVNYEITSKVPNMQGYDKYFFVVNDTLSKGLTFNGDLVVKVGDKTLVKDTDYTLTETNNDAGTTSLKIVFKNFIQYKGQQGAAITITYTATVNQDAVIGSTGGNTNDVELIYSNNPNYTHEGENEPEGNDPHGTTPKKTVYTYVTGLKVKKVDEKGGTLTGAKFQLAGEAMKVVLVNKEIFVKDDAEGTHWMLKDGSYTTTSPDTDGMNQASYDSTTQKYKKITVVNKQTVPTSFEAVGWVNGDGVLTFTGLDAGEYTLTELVAPDGRNLLAAPITITVTGNPTTNGCTWEVKADGTALNSDNDNLYVLTVVNKAGVELPETGGMGTTVFYAVGGLMVLVAVVLLVTKKKMSVTK